MSTKKLGMVGGLALAIVLVVWFGGSWYVTKTAKEKLEDFVVRNDLQNIVFWDDVDASLFGEVRVSNLSIKMGRDTIMIKEMQLHDVVDSEDEKKIDLSLKAIADETGKAPKMIAQEIMEKTGQEDVPPVDLDVKASLDYDSNEGSVQISGNIDSVASIQAQLSARQIAVLKSLLPQLRPESFKGFGIFGLLGELEKAGKAIRFQSAEFSLKDNGGVKKAVALAKRYSVVPLPSEDVEKAQTKALQASLSEVKQRCLQWQGVSDIEAACGHYMAFLSGEKSDLSIVLKSEGGVHSLVDVFAKGLDKGMPGLTVTIEN